MREVVKKRELEVIVCIHVPAFTESRLFPLVPDPPGPVERCVYQQRADQTGPIQQVSGGHHVLH